MSGDKVSLDFLGEQMLRMQADLRGVRSEQVKLEGEQANLRADIHRLDSKIDGLDAKVDGLDAKVDGLDGKVDGLDAKVNGLDAKVDAHDRSNQARFDQIDRTMALNLEIVLAAIRERPAH